MEIVKGDVTEQTVSRSNIAIAQKTLIPETSLQKHQRRLGSVKLIPCQRVEDYSLHQRHERFRRYQQGLRRILRRD